MSNPNLEEFTDARIHLPITTFPPFKLRSSMVDKDPVIWVHLLETYIKYLHTILYNETIQLSEKSEEQLCFFVQTYLNEISDEQGQILSLGLINVDILKNLEIVRSYVLAVIMKMGTLALKFHSNGGVLWGFVRIYVLKNRSIVRSIIDGSWRCLSGEKRIGIGSITVLQKFLEQRIANDKFDKFDLTAFVALLKEPSSGNNKRDAANGKNINKKSNNRSNGNKQDFNEAFVSIFWVELLEKLYANGQGRFAEICKKIGIVCFSSLNNAAIANLATQLGATSYHTLELYPLFGGIITSEKFKELNPGLETKLPFLAKKLKPKKAYGFNKEHIETLLNLFPSMTISKAETLLKSNNQNVEKVTNILLEDDTIIENTPDNFTDSESSDEEIPTAAQIIKKKVNLPTRKNQTSHVPDEVKNKTLEAALRLMYEADEDERDDTYDESETTATVQKMDPVEKLLFELFKSSQTYFSRDERNSKNRKDLKLKTKWSDEQIEGWGRMLIRDPKRFRLVEEKYMNELVDERNNRFEKKKEEDEKSEKKSKVQISEQNKAQDKRQQAKNEKNKSSKGNHNRKRGHDKKMRGAMPSTI